MRWKATAVFVFVFAVAGVALAAVVGGCTSKNDRDKFNAPPSPPPPEPTLLFADEFNQAVKAGVSKLAPDSSKWALGAGCYGWRQQDNCFDPALAYVDSAGHLVLELRKVARFYSPEKGRYYDYMGAELNSFVPAGWPPSTVKWSFAPGTRVEIRGKFPGGPGMWPALWTDAVSSSPPVTEFDIQEQLGKDPTIQHCYIHRWGVSRENHSSASAQMGFDGSATHHTYWLEYRSDSLRIGVDGVTCRTTAWNANGERHGLRLTTQVCDLDATTEQPHTGCWADDVSSSTMFPNRLVIDYVRVYSLFPG